MRRAARGKPRKMMRDQWLSRISEHAALRGIDWMLSGFRGLERHVHAAIVSGVSGQLKKETRPAMRDSRARFMIHDVKHPPTPLTRLRRDKADNWADSSRITMRAFAAVLLEDICVGCKFNAQKKSGMCFGRVV